MSIAPRPASSISFAVAGYDGFSYDGDAASGRIVPNARTSGDSGLVRFKFDQPSSTYTLVTFDPVRQEERYVLGTASPATLSASLSDARFAAYLDPTLPTGITRVLRLFQPGSANPDLQLSYCGFGEVDTKGPGAFLNFGNSWFGYGLATATADIPTTLTSGYHGVVHGFAINPVAGTQFRVEGTNTLTVDFTRRVASGSLNLTLVAADGSRVNVGTAAFAGATLATYLDGSPSPFTGSLTGAAAPFGSVQAGLYGPGGGEVCGIWSARIELPSMGGAFLVHGAFAAVSNK